MRLSYCALLLLLGMPAMVIADAVPGKPAPPFEVKDARGHVQKLSDYQGKWLVLEWFNKDCPYVRKHYGSGNMQGLQQRYVTQGVAWLSVISSAPGKQGYVEPAEALNTVKTTKSAASQVLLDPSGTMGKAYGAKTTPHMFIIDPTGTVVYAGGIDDNDSANPAVIPTSKNYVSAALDAALAGQKVVTASARPYGCHVQY
jgi:AhpC/TSA family